MSFGVDEEDRGSWSLERDGFIILRGFLESDALATVRDAVEAVVRTPCEHACRRPHNELLPLRWSDALVEIFLSCDRRIERLVRGCRAEDLRWISGYVSTKAPDSPPLWWHQDWWCWDHSASFQRAPPQIAVLCYLTCTNNHNGALRLLPGTHHKSAPIHAVLPEAHDGFATGLGMPATALADQPDQITIALEPGDAVAIDYRLLHGTHANKGNTRRDCVILNFAPSWRYLPDEIRGHLICHPALPTEYEAPSRNSVVARLLPGFGGARRDLPLNRNPPPAFNVVSSGRN